MALFLLHFAAWAALDPYYEKPLEATESTSAETDLLIKGSQSIAVKNRSFEGSKEGYVVGTQQTREETLRVSITGKAAATNIEATMFRSSALGSATVAENEEKISIRLKRGSTEAYLGDFTADLNETEFTRLDKVLSGARVAGDYGVWGFKALYSSPKGESKYYRSYGAGTQGPYLLTSAPVVIDSERVFVDGQRQKRGEDYNIDYQSGTISFIHHVVDRLSVLQVYYDYRTTVYQHETYGLRGFLRPSPALKIGLTYLNDSDGLAGAQEIRQNLTAEAINPQSHYIVGGDINLDTDNLTAQGEAAYSAWNRDLLATNGSVAAGHAAKLNLTGLLGPFGLSVNLKRISPTFSRLAEADPRQDVWEFGTALSYRPGTLLALEGEQTYQRYLQDSVLYDNKNITFLALLTPEYWPSLEYNYAQADESNDPVSGDYIRRVITKNSAEINHQVGVISTNLKGSIEEWLRRAPSEEVTDYRRLNFGLATIGLEKINCSANLELEERNEPSGSTPYRRTGNLNLAANPNSQYFLASSLQILQDSAQGDTTVTDLSFRAEPVKGLRAEGKYTISSVQEDFSVTSEAVTKNSGSFMLDLRPNGGLRLRYLFKPNFTAIARTGTWSYNNEQQQFEANLIPLPSAMLGLLYRTTTLFTVDKNDYPNYLVKAQTGQNNSTLYTLKLAPLQILSIELNHTQDNSYGTTLATTQEPYRYIAGQGVLRQVDLVAKTSISEWFSFDTRYTFTKTDNGSGDALANLTDTKSHAASLKGSWNLSDRWTVSLSTAYTRTTDYLLSMVIYTLSPGCGVIYRWGDRLRIDANYLLAQSFAGSSTVKENYSLKAKYGVSDFVNLILRVEREIGTAPDYRLTDISTNVEINL